MGRDALDDLSVGPPFTCAMTQVVPETYENLKVATDADLGEPELREAAAAPAASSGVLGLLIGLLAVGAIAGLGYWGLYGSDDDGTKKRSVCVQGDSEEDDSEGAEDEEKVSVSREVAVPSPAARVAAMPAAT